jgi:hypothetical protein
MAGNMMFGNPMTASPRSLQCSAPLRRRAGRAAAAAGLILAISTGGAHAQPFWAAPALEPSGLAPQASLAPTPPSGAAELMPVERAARIARRQSGGRVLSTSRVQRDGGPGVEVRLLINGSRVTTLFVDNDGAVRDR